MNARRYGAKRKRLLVYLVKSKYDWPVIGRNNGDKEVIVRMDNGRAVIGDGIKIKRHDTDDSWGGGR
jgi:hypothetical protein